MRWENKINVNRMDLLYSKSAQKAEKEKKTLTKND
jgi:hypothetical protein